MAGAAVSLMSLASMAALSLSGCGTASTITSTTPDTPVTSTSATAASTATSTPVTSTAVTEASTATSTPWTTPTPPAEPSDVWAVNFYNYTGLATHGDAPTFSCGSNQAQSELVPWFWCEYSSQIQTRATIASLWFLLASERTMQCDEFQSNDPWNEVMNETHYEDLCRSYNDESDKFLFDFPEFKVYPILKDILSLPSFAAKNVTNKAARSIVTCLADVSLSIPHVTSCKGSTLELPCDGVPRTPVLQIGVVSISVQGQMLEMEFPLGRPWLAAADEWHTASQSLRSARSHRSLASWRTAMGDRDLGSDIGCQDPRPFTTVPYTGPSGAEVSI